jgi:EAL domain-containing protein (putative c-di-GMP-specific phosphodiesterase class I)
MRNLLDTDLVQGPSSSSSRPPVDPSLLTLEITETNVMSDPSRTIAVLERLAVSVCGCPSMISHRLSSLSYLQRLPVHE